MVCNTIKKTLTTALLAVTAMTSIIALPSQAYANDGVYYMSGNQLVPMHTTQIDVKKEVLDIRREGNEIIVNVHYELYNSGKPISLLVGFEAMPPSGDANGLPKNGEHPYMTDFTAKINDTSVQYQVALVPTDNHWKNINNEFTLNLDKAQSPFYFQNGRINQEKESTLRARSDGYETDALYVYHFTANFQSGKNIIDHSYRFEASGTFDNNFECDYVLTAINRWGDSTIEDFQLNLDMGALTEFNIVNSFFDSANEWHVEGVGKSYPTPKNIQSYYHSIIDKSTTFAMRSGNVTFKKKNFTPKDDIFLLSPAYASYNGLFDANKHNLSLNYLFNIEGMHSDDVKDLDDFSRQVLHNFPFARRGYVFKNAKLQAYYNRQPWYIADNSYKANYSQLNKSEQTFVKRFE